MPYKDTERRRVRSRERYAKNKAAGIKRDWGVLDCVCPICHKVRQISKNQARVTTLSRDKAGYTIKRCRSCSKTKSDCKYKNNEYVRDYQNRLQRGLKIKSIRYLGGACIDCGLEYDGKNAYVFDFHHRDPKDKEFYPTSRMRKFETVKKELDKCDLLCVICHRSKHCEQY